MAQPSPNSLHSLVVVRLRAVYRFAALAASPREGGMTIQEQEIFHEMLAALQDVVNWYGAPTQGDVPAIARAKQALAKAEAFKRGHLTTED